MRHGGEGTAIIVIEPLTSTASQLCWAGGVGERERRPRLAATATNSEAGAGDGDDASRVDSATALAAALSRAKGM